MTRRRSGLILVLLCIVAIATGCQTNPVTGRSQLMMYDEAEEIQMGNETAPYFVKQSGGLYPDRDTQDYVQIIGEHLARNGHRPHLKYHFYVVNSPQINAFALPGGHVFITRGLFLRLRSEDQLAAVLGHEVGHVTARHSLAQMSSAMFSRIVLHTGLIVANVSSDRFDNRDHVIAAQFGELMLTLRDLKHGRDDEYQSDELALHYSAKTGFDPQGMKEVLIILKDAGAGSRRPPEFLSTHPMSENRIAKVENEMEALARAGKIKPSGRPTDSSDFVAHVDRMKNRDTAYRLAQSASTSRSNAVKLQLLDKALTAWPENGHFLAERSLAHLEAGDPEKALADADAAAAQPESRYSGLVARAQALAAVDRIPEAKTALKEAEKILPKDADVHLAAGLVEKKSGNLKAAKHRFQFAAELAGEGPQKSRAQAELRGLR